MIFPNGSKLLKKPCTRAMHLLFKYRLTASRVRQVTQELIVQGLRQESLGLEVGRLPTGERLFSPVSLEDFKSRCLCRVSELEAIRA